MLKSARIFLIVLCCIYSFGFKIAGSYRLLDKGDKIERRAIDYQLVASRSDWEKASDFDRYHFLWNAVANFESFNNNCSLANIQPSIDYDNNKMIINIWCSRRGEMIF